MAGKQRGDLDNAPSPRTLLKTRRKILFLALKTPRKKKIYHAEIKPYRKKRSLDSNAYAWLLINEIANVLRASKDEIYLSMLKSYGQSSVVSVVEEAVEMFMASVKYREGGSGPSGTQREEVCPCKSLQGQ